MLKIPLGLGEKVDGDPKSVDNTWAYSSVG